MTNRRKYVNGYKPRTVKPAVGPLCEACCDLKLTPAFTESLMAVHKISATQVQGWWHLRGHSIFQK